MTQHIAVASSSAAPSSRRKISRRQVMIGTAGSNAVTSYYRPLRVFGAQVRRVLLDNAGKKLGVPVAELTTEPSAVVHAASGRRIGYGEIAAFAEVPSKAPEIKAEELKKPS